MQHMSDLTRLDYIDPCNHLSKEERFIGDNTAALLTLLYDNDGKSVQSFYKNVIRPV